MLFTKTLFALFIPLFMAVQPAPGGRGKTKPPAQMKTASPVFSSIDKDILGVRWYAYYLFDKKNVGSMREETLKTTYKGRDAYEMRDHMKTSMPPIEYDGYSIAICDVDFTLIRFVNDYTETDEETGKPRRERMVCETRSRDTAECEQWTEGGATETVTFKTTDGGPFYYDGAIDRLERSASLDPGSRLKLHFIDTNQKKAKHLVSTFETIDTAAPAGSKKIYNFMPDGNIETTVFIGADKDLIQFKWSDGEIQLSGYRVENEKAAAAERMKPVSEVPPAERTPEQVAILFLTSVTRHNKEKLESVLDLRTMYETFKEKIPDYEPPAFEEWKNMFLNMMSDVDTSEEEERGDVFISDYDMETFMEAASSRIMTSSIEGDTATVSFSEMFSDEGGSLLMRRTAQGWKIYWLDFLDDIEEEIEEE